MEFGRPGSGAMSLEDILNYLSSAMEVPPDVAAALDGPYARAARAAGLGAGNNPILAGAAISRQGVQAQPSTAQTAPSKEPPIHDYQEAFLTQLEPEAERIAKQYNFNKDHLLGLAAHESGWLKDPNAIANNDPLGINLPGTKTLRRFNSIPEAFDYWGRLWGRSVSGATTPNDFIARMQSRSVGKYNSADPNYNSNLEGTVNSAVMRDRQWEQMGRPRGKMP